MTANGAKGGREMQDNSAGGRNALCPGCPYRALFYTLNKYKCTVLVHTGCYTLGAVAPLAA